MAIFRLQENTPVYYQEESLDFQLISRLYDVINNGFLFNAQTIPNILNTKQCNSNMLQLLQTKLGFFTQNKLNDENLYGALQCFKLLVYNKGSKEAIQGAVNLFSKINNIQNQISVVYNTQETQYESITIPANSLVIGVQDKIKDVTLLDELFRYILPAGIPYFIYFYQNIEKYTSAMVQNKADVLFVTESIGSQLRQYMFGYYHNSQFYYDELYTEQIPAIQYNIYIDKSDSKEYVYVNAEYVETDDADLLAERLIAGVDTLLVTAPVDLTDTPDNSIANRFYAYNLGGVSGWTKLNFIGEVDEAPSSPNDYDLAFVIEDGTYQAYNSGWITLNYRGLCKADLSEPDNITVVLSSVSTNDLICAYDVGDTIIKDYT